MLASPIFNKIENGRGKSDIGFLPFSEMFVAKYKK
jgi:hypothetical protein